MSEWNQAHNRTVWVDIPVVELDRAIDCYSTVLKIQVSKKRFGKFRSLIRDSEGNRLALHSDTDA